MGAKGLGFEGFFHHEDAKGAKDFVLIFGEPCAGVDGFWLWREARSSPRRREGEGKTAWESGAGVAREACPGLGVAGIETQGDALG
ncbi:MAG: hypothetical protein ACKOS8_01530 [Gemmataceae bacterium]